MSLARYGFLPWLRQGISARINDPDTLGTPVGKTGRPSVDISLSLSGVQVGAQAFSPIADPAETTAHPDKPVYKTLELIGPGDITGIKASAVVKTEPWAGVSTFEPNYLPYVEFYEEDFPWRYTPASASGDRLRPWLVLVVLAEDEFERRFFPGAPLSAITHGKRAIAFPPKEETWAWAHVHVNKPLTGDDKPAALRQVVDETPNLASSRLLCPRLLQANTSYTAFLLPAFEQGRLAGLGAPADRIRQTDIQACSWEAHPGDEYANLWPVYFEWDFRTSDLADFEYLVRRIEARVLEHPVGRRLMDMQDAGYELSYKGGDGTLFLEGALQVIGAQDPGNRFDFLNGGDPEDDFIQGLQTMLNLNTDLQEGAAGDAPANQTLYTDGGAQDDPIVTPPLYGQWHADAFRADADDPVFWFNELNLDPRNRVAAGFGTFVVRKNQDAFMDRAWEQVGEVLEAQRRIRLDRFAAETGRKLQATCFDGMDESSFAAFSSSFHARSRFVEGGSAQETTVLEVARRRRTQPDGLETLLTSQQTELDQAKADLAQARADLRQILDDIEAKEAEIQATKTRISSLEAQIDELNAAIAALEQEIEAKEQEIQNKEQEIEVKEQEILQKEQEIANKEQEIQTKQTELANAIAANAGAATIAALNAQISQKQQELTALNADLADLEAELLTLKGELANLQAALQVLEEEKQDKETTRQSKQSELAAEQALLQQQQNQLAELEQDRLEMEQKILGLEGDILRLTDTINRLARLYLPPAALRQDYRKLARSNGPVFRRAAAGVQVPKALQDLSGKIDPEQVPVDNLQAEFLTKDWNNLVWKAVLFADPPAEEPEVVPVTTTSTKTIRGIIKDHIQTAQALNKRRQTLFAVQTTATPEADQTPKLLLTYPEFKEAMYAALAEISSELMLPNVQLVPMDTFSLLEVNQRFIESYLVGLNHEMARELLWREYPTDQRGSYFRRFWDDLDNLAETPPPPDIKLLTALDQPLGQNMPEDRDIPPPSPEDPYVVFVIRSELLKKFPTALVYMQKAGWGGEGQPRVLVTEQTGEEPIRRMPIFKASINPEVSFFGFPVTAEEALGDEVDAGWFFVVQERPGEPRFGMDINPEEESQTFGNIGEWNDLAWPMITPDAKGFITLLSQSERTLPPKSGVADQYTWSRNAAHMAGILLQLPFMVAVHATDMIKLPE